METKSKTNVFKLVTDRIIGELEKGFLPWKKNWVEVEIPSNIITLKPYRGTNIILLTSLGYEENYFISYNQIKEMGFEIKEGEQACPVIYWKYFVEVASKKKPELRYYSAYHISQIEDFPEDKIPVKVKRAIIPVQAFGDLFLNMPNKPEIKHEGDKPFYSTEHDCINMPLVEQFESPEMYFEYFFKVLIHATGHPDRLDRKEMMDGNDKKDQYNSTEELIAEIGAGFLMALIGLDNTALVDEDSIQGWLSKLRKDDKCFVYACIRAQKAVDFILNTDKTEEA